MNTYDYIQGSKFYDLADNKCQELTRYDQCILPDLNISRIIYCHTELVNQLFSQIDKTKSFILISHNGDGKATFNPKRYDADINLIPNNLVKWYAANLVDQHEKIVAIPTGLENSHILSGTKKIEKLYQQTKQKKQYRNLCYLNFNPNTNPNERIPIYQQLKDKPWATTEFGQNGQNYTNYVNQIYNHTFVLCPEGNHAGHTDSTGATGSHRLWECLYLNSIPIIRKGPQSLLFNDLPIVFIDDWKQITESFLQKQYEIIQTTVWNTFKLNMSYWKELINDQVL